MRRRWPVPAAIVVAATLFFVLDARSSRAAVSPQPGGGQELCWHDITSETRCPDSLRRLDVNPESILSVEVKFNMQGGLSKTKRVVGKVDAIFLTAGALRSFALPYYAGRDDAKTQRILDLLRQTTRTVPARGRGETR
jgi:hypothetical protein